MKGRPAIFRRFPAVSLVCILALLITACFQVGDPPTPTPNPTATPAPVPPASYELELIADPREAADFLVNPRPDSEGGYLAGTSVTVDVLPKAGWRIEQ